MPANRSSVQLLEHTSEKACVKETGYLCVLGNPASPRELPSSVHLSPEEVEAWLARGYREDSGASSSGTKDITAPAIRSRAARHR